MIVYFLPSVSGLTRWVDYIPVKFTTVATAATENTYNQNGYIPVVSLSSIAGATPFKEYVPVFLDSSAADADVWDVTITGFIPVGTAGIGGAALYLDFAATTSLDRRITFSRTTNATVTGSNGLIQNAPMNLLTFSEQFDNGAWTKQQATVTANAVVAPDGTTTADKLVEDSTNNVHRAIQVPTTTAVSTTFTVYAKAAERTWCYLANASANHAAYFNLATGVVGTLVGPTTATITPVGNGWYRCAITSTPAAGAQVYGVFIATADAVNSYLGNGISGINIWGAQLESSATATTYNPTTVKNLLGFTEHFDNAAWTKSNASISATKVDDIYGQPFAQKLVEDTANTTHRIRQTVSLISAPQTFSVYAKAAERSWVYLVDASIAGGSCYFDLANGVKGTQGANAVGEITLVGNGWYRCSIKVTLLGGGDSFDIRVATADGTQSYTGDGTSGIYIFGAQLSDSASVDPYVYQPVAAPTSTAYYGPRFDYDPVTLAPKGLLIEEQRTNSLLASSILGSQVVVCGAVPYTLSFYGTGTVVLSGTHIATVVGTGAYPTRTTYTFTPTAGVLVLTVTGSVTSAQLEAGAFATSYIPTVASQVTRAADSASMIGTNFARWYTQGVGTVFVDSAQVAGGANTLAFTSAGTNIIRLGGGRMDVFVAGTQVASLGTTTAGTVKHAGAYSTNDFALSVNGAAVTTDTSGAVPIVDSATFSSSVGGYANGTIKRIAYYPRRLANTELTSITS
jgi:hypothetical protein